jgi:RimJ/RimL family protein N-acetyltransferase
MLKGERVTLRALERDDLKRLHELSQDVELALLGDGEWQPTPLAAWEKDFEKRLEDREHAKFAIEADGKLIGDIQLQMRDQRSRVAGLGIAIYDRDYLGRGYGREAIELFLDWAFRIQNYTRIWLTVWASNERAIRCYRAAGFAEEGRQRKQIFVDGKYVDVVLMGVLRDEWRPAGRMTR